MPDAGEKASPKSKSAAAVNGSPGDKAGAKAGAKSGNVSGEPSFILPGSSLVVKQARPSFCVITRIFDAELPYVESFVRHYASLGVCKVYFVNTFRAQYGKVCKFLEGLGITDVTIEVVNTYDDAGPVNQKMNEALHDDIEDFVINVDIDEFWILPSSFRDLRSLVSRRPADVYWFYWVMVPHDGLHGAPTAPYLGYHGHNGKYMVRSSRLTWLHVHEPHVRNPKTAVWTQCGHALHFWGRGFKDVLLKVAGQKIGNEKTSNRKELLHLASTGDIPVRLKLLAYFMLQKWSRASVEKVQQVPQLLQCNQALEEKLLRKYINKMQFKKIRALYLSFSRRLYEPQVSKMIPDYGTGANDLEIAQVLSTIPATKWCGHGRTAVRKLSRRLSGPRHVSSSFKVIARHLKKGRQGGA
jgi:hypothetical protein